MPPTYAPGIAGMAGAPKGSSGGGGGGIIPDPIPITVLGATSGGGGGTAAAEDADSGIVGREITPVGTAPAPVGAAGTGTAGRE